MGGNAAPAGLDPAVAAEGEHAIRIEVRANPRLSQIVNLLQWG